MSRTKSEIEDEEEDRAYNVSSIAVSSEEKEAEIPVNQDEIFTSRAHTKKFFKDLGFSLGDYEYEVYGPSGRQLGVDKGQQLFFNQVTIQEEPITKRIKTMKRLKAFEYYKNEKGRYQKRVKEFLVYNANVSGLDRFGNEIKTRITNGVAYEPDVKIRISHDEYGKSRAEYTFDHLRNHYYLPYSKKAVDDLIAKTRTDKNSIRFYCEVGSDPNGNTTKFRCDTYNYSDFVNKTFEELQQLAFAPNKKWADKPADKQWVGN